MTDSMTALLLARLDSLSVPDGDLRRVVAALGEMIDRPDSPGHIAVALDAWKAMWPAICELYEPKSPLQVQRDYERARREATAAGLDVPAWDDLSPTQRAEES